MTKRIAELVKPTQASLDAYDEARRRGIISTDSLTEMLVREENGPSTVDLAVAADNVRLSGVRAPKAGIARVLTNEERAFAKYLRSGRVSAWLKRGAERRDMSEGSLGSYLAAPSFYADTMTALQYASAFLSVGPRIWESTTGSPGSYPIATGDTSNVASQISENTQVSELDVTISKITFSQTPLYTSGVIRAGKALVQDAGFDLQGFLIDVFSKRLARALDLEAATVALAASWVNSTTTAANTAITFTDLANVVFSIDPAYLASASCGWVVSPTVALKLKTTLDSSNRPVLLDAPYTRTTEDVIGGSNRSMVIGTMLGFPVYLSKNMPTFAAGKAGVALFGDFDHGLIWRQVQRDEVTVLVERFADEGEIGYLHFARHDFAVADLNAVGVLNVHS